jgi:catechol 2,3-dioxygenase-like lactoylglutathione lyase family enzyme
MAMIRTKGVAHFTIPCSDTRVSEKFYVDVLGMKSIRGNHDRGMIFLDCGGDCIVLLRVDQPISTARVRDCHTAFIVDSADYAEAVRKLQAADSIEYLYEEDMQGGAVNGPRAYFHDPDGNVLEIIDLTSYLGDELRAKEAAGA